VNIAIPKPIVLSIDIIDIVLIIGLLIFSFVKFNMQCEMILEDYVTKIDAE
jgi:hypothetical protein